MKCQSKAVRAGPGGGLTNLEQWSDCDVGEKNFDVNFIFKCYIFSTVPMTPPQTHLWGHQKKTEDSVFEHQAKAQDRACRCLTSY